MTDRLAAAFQRAAHGAATVRDDREVAAVFEEQRGQVDRTALVQGAAERFGMALLAAIHAGAPRIQALQGFLRMTKAGVLRETGGAVVFEPSRAAHPMTASIAEQALRIALAGAGAPRLSVHRSNP